MIRLIRALSSLHGEQYTEPYIAKAKFERYGNLVGENIQTKMTVEKEKAKFVLIIIDLYNEKIVSCYRYIGIAGFDLLQR